MTLSMKHLEVDRNKYHSRVDTAETIFASDKRAWFGPLVKARCLMKKRRRP